MGVNEAVTPPFPNSDHWYAENSHGEFSHCVPLLRPLWKLMNRL